MTSPRRTAVWLIAALFAYALVTAPRQTAAGTRHLLGLLATGAQNLVVFVHQVLV
ncbi:hypothetical protein [Actinopolyspora erythraea]|uniref:hypothetical protein n=1 Tax=Actinopolyspora erythraea TaxID=414996 RepID=UPI000AE181DD|nr:hypothetical protein [Actinopolyspora erythraea]